MTARDRVKASGAAPGPHRAAHVPLDVRRARATAGPVDVPWWSRARAAPLGFTVVERVARSAADTERFAAQIARTVRAPLVLLLDGELGAGKTTFTRGFVRALDGGDRVVVQSPTFALARTYKTVPPVHHVDLYRLDAPGHAVEELGIAELLDDPVAFCLVEWPRDLVVAGAARIFLRDDASGTGRHVRAELPAAAVRPPATRSRRA